MWFSLVEPYGVRSQSLYLSRNRNPAIRAIRSSSLGQEYRCATPSI